MTIFLKGEPDFGQTDPQGRPDFPFSYTPETGVFVAAKGGLRGLSPEFLVYSSGYNLNDDSFNPLAAAVQPWPGTQGQSSAAAFGSHPLVYVTAGTHRNLFSLDATVTSGTSSPNTALNTTGAALMGAAGSAMGICAGVLLATPPPVDAVGFVVCVVVAAILFVLGIILFILSFLFPSTTPQTETPQSTQAGSDVARDDGPAAVPTTSSTTFSSNASSVVEPTLRLISEFGFDPAAPITTYPLPAQPLPANGI